MKSATSTSYYGSMNIALHWTTLVLMIAIYASIEWHETLPRGTDLRRLTEDWHIYLGLILLPLALFRFVVILRTSIPAITPTPPRWQLIASTTLKVYLYVLMIGMPIIGWIMLSAEGHSVAFFSIPLPALAPESEALADIAKEAHEILGTSGYAFITLHAIAGLYHHFIVKDDTLRRMLPKALRR
jgi:cytochrome b561